MLFLTLFCNLALLLLCPVTSTLQGIHVWLLWVTEFTQQDYKQDYKLIIAHEHII